MRRLLTVVIAASANVAEREEGGTSVAVLLQELDHVLRRRFVLGDDVLNRAAEGRLDRRLVLRRYLDEVCHNAEDTASPVALVHDHFDRIAVALIALREVTQGLEAVLETIEITVLLDDPLTQLLILGAEPIHQRGITRDDGIDLLEALTERGELLPLVLDVREEVVVLHRGARLGLLHRTLLELEVRAHAARHGELGLVHRGTDHLEIEIYVFHHLVGRRLVVADEGDLVTDPAKETPVILDLRDTVEHVLSEGVDSLRVVQCVVLFGVDLLVQDIDLSLEVRLQDIRLADGILCLLELLIEGMDLLLELVVLAIQLLGLLLDRGEVLLDGVCIGIYRIKALQRVLHVAHEEVRVGVHELVTDRQVLAGLLGLPLQRADLALELGEDVRHTREVRFLVAELLLGEGLPALELHDADGLIEEVTTLLRLTGEDLVDLALSDDGVAVLTDTGIVEKLVDVLQTTLRAVQHVLRLARAVETTGNRHLVVIDIQDAVRIIEGDRHEGRALRAAKLRAGEDDILHGASTQLLHLLLTEYPAHRVGDVRFSRAVRADDARDALTEIQDGLVRKGLEALNLNRF